MDKIFVYIFNFFTKNKFVYWSILIGTIGILSFFAIQIELEEDITQMLPMDEKTEKSNRILSNTQFLDKLIVRISLSDTTSSPKPDVLTAFADQFVERINQEPIKNHIKDIQAQINEESILKIQNIIYKNLPFFLSEEDYNAIDTFVTSNGVDNIMQNNYKLLVSPASVMLKQNIMRDPIGITNLALAKFKSLQPDNQYEIYDGYILSKGQKDIFIFLTSMHPPNETAGNTLLINALDNEIKTLLESNKEISVEYFGTPAIAVANATQIKNDIAFTMSIALIFILFILWFYFRNLLVLPIILLPALFGAIFSLAVIYLIKTKISVIALGAGTIVLGVAINYSLHILVHYKHIKSMREVIKDVSIATIVGCITTVGAFFCLLFVKAELLRDFGLFAGLTLMGAALFSILFLPMIINTIFHKREDKLFNVFKLIENTKFKLPNPIYARIWVVIILLLTIIFLYTSQYAGFESDMSKMNYMSPKLKVAEKHLNKMNTEALKPLYLIFSGKNIDEALENNEKIISSIRSTYKGKVELQYAGVSDILVSEKIQHERLKLWNNYWTKERKQLLKIKVNNKAKQLGFKENSFADFYQLLDYNFQYVFKEDLFTLKKEFLKDYINESSQITTILATITTTDKTRGGIVHILANDPDVVIVDKQNLTARFVQLINAELNTILTLSSLLVFFVLLISYGRIELTILTFMPMLITWIWILGLMGIFGIKFNLINIIISTFIFGLGDDYSIFISDGLLNEYKTGKKHLRSFTISILLSALTTIIGIGVLIFAIHPAIKSIALISVVGIICTVIISYSVLPFLFRFLLLNRKKKMLPPITFRILFYSIIAYSLFLIGCVVLNISGFLLFSLLRIKSKKVKLGYHYLLMYSAKMMAYSMINIKKNITNSNNESFSTPSIIISNHQSFVDIIIMLTLHPKLIMITNEWVWNSPFFGNIVRYADFQPTSNSMEDGFLKLSQKVEEGYSILIFPEGTRSTDAEIARFHKGAFYLSEKLNVDILPVIIHGSSYIMTKGDDLLLKSGSISLNILPRITPSNQEFGVGYVDKSKKIKKYFENEFIKVRQHIETPKYFVPRLISNYIYKGPILEWYSKIKVKIEDEYSLIQSYVPLKATIVDIGCGYGFLAYLLSYKSKERNILGIDYDDEKIEVANNCYSKTQSVNFINCDILAHNFEKTDVFILMDVLHYMEEIDQKKLIGRCLENLNNNGVMIIRDSDCSKHKTHKKVADFEFFSTHIGFNKSVENKLHFVSSDTLHSIANEYEATIEQIHSGKQSSNTFYIIKPKNNG